MALAERLQGRQEVRFLPRLARSLVKRFLPTRPEDKLERCEIDAASFKRSGPDAGARTRPHRSARTRFRNSSHSSRKKWWVTLASSR